MGNLECFQDIKMLVFTSRSSTELYDHRAVILSDLGVHGLTSLVESGSGVERRNSSRAISVADILSRATAWRVFSAQCSPNMARLKSASARRRCCSRFTDSRDRPWRWRGPKHRHKYWDGQHTHTGIHGISETLNKDQTKGTGLQMDNGAAHWCSR